MSESLSFSRALNPAKTSPAVVTWLVICCLLIVFMISVGGLTRLTQSGLSMVEWKPVTGIMPPTSAEQWTTEFDKYKQSPEYKIVNKGMTLDGFKSIYYMEWGHRVLGRLIGVVFLVPFLFFLITRRLNARWVVPLLSIFILGGLQGLLGWYMVKSGLVNDPSVSQYRLTAHLSLAVFLYGCLLWVTLSMARGRTVFVRNHSGARTFFAWCVVLLVGLMIITGGFMAGTKAGHVHNTFPQIDGAWIPANIWAMDPWWMNLFENVTTIQAVHRYLAMFTAVFTICFCLANLRRSFVVVLMLLVVIGQFTLGVMTLLGQVPVHLGVAHQAVAILLLTTAIVALHRIKSGA